MLKEKKANLVPIPYLILLYIPTLLLFIIGMSGEEGPLGPGSVIHAFFSAEQNAEITELRLRGSLLLGMVFFSFGLISKGFRKAQRWAWYVLWYWPVFFILHIYAFSTWIPDLPLLLLCLLGLLLPYKKFFSRDESTE